jgi:hypothetical protein
MQCAEETDEVIAVRALQIREGRHAGGGKTIVQKADKLFVTTQWDAGDDAGSELTAVTGGAVTGSASGAEDLLSLRLG